MRAQRRTRGDLFDDMPETAHPPVLGEDVHEETDEEVPSASEPDLSGDLSDTAVFVPAHPGVDEGETTIRFELRQASEDEKVAPAFTSVEKLVEQLGEAQPWVSVTVERLRALTQAMGVEKIYLDPEVDPGTGRWTDEDLEDFRE